ncbi:DUF4238 domain-containing protein [Legionella worsleiensis]|uniref:DUF4238 domain-containing protein n=1 Tax=Legionella worsleiensis TaxID=45076 RepID=A0A0W1A4G4_9GAMM|nr:DUF4238 domain-containing protein [Legionella worsleiensis]KTD75907.1 hypothetical protein Lwor_2473 [Legionella worsleiensis]STY32920.1 Uncharacterised protein [Legionella worsleiensis]
MVDKSLNRDDHYVSRTYLKEFISIPKHVFVYRKKEKLEKNMPINSICTAKGGDICHGLENIFAVRQVLSNLEPAWNLFIESVKSKKIIATNNSTPKEDGLTLLSRISLYIAYLRCLSPTMVGLGQEQQERILNDYLLKMLAESNHVDLDLTAKKAILDGKIKARVDDEDYFKARSAGFLGEFGNLIYHRNWEILVNKSSTKFITSDTPCILPAFLSETHVALETLAYRKPDPIYLPLTPEYALIIRASLGRGLSYIELTPSQVRQFNKEIVKSAYDMVISYKYDSGISVLVNKYRNYHSIVDFKTLQSPQGTAIITKQKNVSRETEAFI